MCLLTETRALSAQGEKRALVGNLTMPPGVVVRRQAGRHPNARGTYHPTDPCGAGEAGIPVRARRLGRRRCGTATLDTDYTLSSTTITLAAGETAGTVTVTVTDDAEDDDGETIVIDAESTSPALTAEPLTLTIEDNDVTPVPAWLPLRGALLLGLLLTLLGAVRMRMRERTDIARGC